MLPSYEDMCIKNKLCDLVEEIGARAAGNTEDEHGFLIYKRHPGCRKMNKDLNNFATRMEDNDISQELFLLGEYEPNDFVAKVVMTNEGLRLGLERFIKEKEEFVEEID